MNFFTRIASLTTTRIRLPVHHSSFRIHHPAFRILHSSSRILHSAFCIPHSSFCILHSAFRILHSSFRILHSSFCIPHFSLLLSLLSFSSFAATINYQGTLADNLGAVISNGTYQIEFRIWDDPTASGASDLIWGRAFPVNVVNGGDFQVLLQDGGTALTPAPAVAALRDAFQGADRYLGLTIIQTPSGPVSAPKEISARQRLISVPYSFYACNADKAYSVSNALNASNAAHVINSDKLGGLTPSNYVRLANFPGAQSPAKMFLWDGTNATTIPAYINGNQWVISNNLQVTGLTVTPGAIIPAIGSNLTQGLEFPANPGSGAGDRAWIKYYVTNGENGCLYIGVENDPQDDLEIRPSGQLNLGSTAGGTVRFSGGTVAITGTVSALGPWELKAEWYTQTNSTYQETAATDGFLLVHVVSTVVDINVGEHGYVYHLSSDYDDDTNYGPGFFPITKGDTWNVKYVSYHQSDYAHVKVYWRSLGK